MPEKLFWLDPNYECAVVCICPVFCHHHHQKVTPPDRCGGWDVNLFCQSGRRSPDELFFLRFVLAMVIMTFGG